MKFDDPTAVLTSAMAALNSEEFNAVVAHCEENSVLSVARQLAAILSDSAFDRFRGYLMGYGAFDELGNVQVTALRDAAILVAAWIGWNSPREQVRRLVAAGEVDPDLANSYSTPHPPPRVLEIVGFVIENDVAHVIHRLVGPAAPHNEVRVAQCRRSESLGWLLLARHDMLGILTTITRLSRS